jgi:hypothetical protein
LYFDLSEIIGVQDRGSAVGTKWRRLGWGAMFYDLIMLPSALYLRSVCLISVAFCGLRCHPLACIVLKLRLSVDSSPT